jgi:hypothetical protein
MLQSNKVIIAMACRAPRHNSLSIVLIGILIIAANASQCYAASSEGKLLRVSGAPQKRKVKFKPVKVGEITDNKATSLGFESFGKDERTLAFTIFKASDGKTLTLQHGVFRSSDEAKRFWDWKITNSSKALKQEKKLDNNGRVVGFRAEVATAADAYGKTSSAIMWTEEKQFYVIFADSISDALELEKMYAQ